MSELKIFENAQFGAVRVVMINDDPWFVARDVATCLGYTNPAEAVRNYCKKAVAVGEHTSANPLFTGVSVFRTPVNSGSQSIGNCSPFDPKTKLIPESDVYRLVMRSHLPSAEAFQDWVVEDVLPSIRKTGMYATPKDFPSALRALADTLEREKTEREAKLAAQAALKEKTETLAIVSNELEIANDQLGYAREFRSCIALADELAAYFKIQCKDFAGDSFYAQLGKFMTRLCNGKIVPDKTFEIKKEYVPNARYNWINVYSIAAWDYFFNMCQTGQISASTKFIGNFWRG